MLHTPLKRDKSFMLAAGVPAALLCVLVYQGVLLTEGLIVALCALPLAFVTASKGKQAYLMSRNPPPTESK